MKKRTTTTTAPEGIQRVILDPTESGTVRMRSAALLARDDPEGFMDILTRAASSSGEFVLKDKIEASDAMLRSMEEGAQRIGRCIDIHAAGGGTVSRAHVRTF